MWEQALNFRFLCITLTFSSSVFAQRQYPSVNCPNIFKYAFDSRYGGHYGLITVRRDGTSISEVEIKMSMNSPGHIYNNLQIITLSKTPEFFKRDSILNYAVRFPVQSVIPKLTSLKFNSKLLCSGMPDPLIPGVVQTNMWAKSTVTTFGPFHSQSFQSTQVIQTPSDKVSRTLPSPTVSPVSHVAFTSLPYQCGVAEERNSESLFPYTQEVGPGDFPWLAAIVYKQKTDYEFRCTGTVISEKHILTADDCVKNSSVNAGKDGNLLIVLGKLRLDDSAKTNSTVKKIRSVETNSDSGIAILILNEPIIFQPAIRPICLWNGGEEFEQVVGTSGMMVGWTTEEGGRVPKSAKLSVVPQELCFRSNKFFGGEVTRNVFCTDTGNSVSTICGHDSGASFIVKDNLSGKWFLRGLVNHLLRDPISLSCNLNHYLLLTDVAKTRVWIEKTITKLIIYKY